MGNIKKDNNASKSKKVKKVKAKLLIDAKKSKNKNLIRKSKNKKLLKK